MADFVSVLIVAVLLLIGLLIVFGGASIFLPSGYGGNAQPSKTIVLGQNLAVMYMEGQNNVTSLKGEVSQGVFGNEKQKTEFAVDNYKDVSEGIIKLKVLNSNYYGAFIININGQLVYQGVPEIGEKTITFDGSVLKSDNEIGIEAESSGWKLWAPNIYLFNADLSVNYIGKTTQSLSFDLTSSEMKNINRARLLVFGTRNGPGDLLVKINGMEVFSGLTPIYTDFSTDNLKVGNNVLDLSTEKNTAYNLTTVQLVLFF
jgi:hypothetical protein